MNPTPLFDLRKVIPFPLPTLTILDVGAAALAGHAVAYQELLTLGVGRVIGFEPDEAACARLNASARPGDRYLPFAIGDGSAGVFRSCANPFTSSLLEPNAPLLDLFQTLPTACAVHGRTALQTHRLDDLPEVAEADFLKMDVQGAEYHVLQGAQRLLERLVVIQTEVEFVPLYRDQPLFADIDRSLRAAGFLFHRFLGMAGRPFSPFSLKEDSHKTISQQLWSDAVYVRDFTRLDDWTAEQVLKMAIVLHTTYSSVDLAHLCLAAYDRKTKTALADAYLAAFSR